MVTRSVIFGIITLGFLVVVFVYMAMNPLHFQ
jgi:hypothetical protein